MCLQADSNNKSIRKEGLNGVEDKQLQIFKAAADCFLGTWMQQKDI